MDAFSIYALACWGFPNPIFTLRVAARVCETLMLSCGEDPENEKARSRHRAISRYPTPVSFIILS
ncbi:MAG: hypothetical protein IJ229_01250, partial [Clostridia bacterium]|nr:hypothetical protein [Clostridia bacterium]